MTFISPMMGLLISKSRPFYYVSYLGCVWPSQVVLEWSRLKRQSFARRMLYSISVTWPIQFIASVS